VLREVVELGGMFSYGTQERMMETRVMGTQKKAKRGEEASPNGFNLLLENEAVSITREGLNN
jgi:hypothetical protein